MTKQSSQISNDFMVVVCYMDVPSLCISFTCSNPFSMWEGLIPRFSLFVSYQMAYELPMMFCMMFIKYFINM